ncbi:(R-S)-reticuline 7-O-methyltransferase-like [Pyrus ussuriensis x Pyrus communis]|uniref:(R-S)-reticuline 7-O-methyltransferase-like n=1 Tax=Pyrus ussuriensis x Pyrus communis TaxID=2448454 RepID=A0A5N5G5I4_9ROSA|nr:(R-S)-reticuline 7-O-methyltransferase-like [Pyrus ussuriensis x Pyrus communis]
MLVMKNHPCLMAPWHYFGRCIKGGGPFAFKMAHGLEIWDYASQNLEFNKLFNGGMACTARVVMKAILTGYEHGFDSIGSLVDVGGGTGGAVAEIVKAYPNSRVSILICRIDSDCIKILKSCQKVIPEKSWKIIIVDIVLEPNGEGILDDTGLVFDLLMIAHASGGRERTESEWKKILEGGGFPRYKVIKIPTIASIVEAYPM